MCTRLHGHQSTTEGVRGAHWLSLPYWGPEPQIQAGTPRQGWLLASPSLCIKRLCVRGIGPLLNLPFEKSSAE